MQSPNIKASQHCSGQKKCILFQSSAGGTFASCSLPYLRHDCVARRRKSLLATFKDVLAGEVQGKIRWTRRCGCPQNLRPGDVVLVRPDWPLAISNVLPLGISLPVLLYTEMLQDGCHPAHTIV